jgi:predicted anti-sigma-YlaC factor YlaD
MPDGKMGYGGGRLNTRVLAGVSVVFSGCLLLYGCGTVRKLAVNSFGNALAAGGSSYSTDDDPELVREAIPFGLKTIESLLSESPRHKGLLYAAVSGFTQYAYAFVQQEADFVESKDLARATALRNRSKRLYLRALDYGFRGLEVDLPDFRKELRASPEKALAKADKRHVPLLYWTASAWGAAISLSKEDAELTADQPSMEALMRRALALDEAYDYGSIHDFFITYEGSRGSVGGSLEKAREHFERAVELSKGHRAWPFVSLAEVVSVASQNRKEFQQLLEKALSVDQNAVPDLRLTNLIAKERARWLLSRADELFVE